MNGKPKIYLLGSGKLAIPFLTALYRSQTLHFVGGATGVSKPGKRGKKLLPTAAKSFAGTLGIELEEVPDVNDPAYLERVKALAPDIILVVSFGQILRRDILALPKSGCVNVHPSLLPRYRGASPVVQAVLNQDDETGVCYMQVAPALDAGNIYRVFRRKLDGSEYADELEAELAETAARHLDETLTGILSGELPGIPQTGNVVVCGKIAKSDAAINWSDDARSIAAKVRAYHAWPGAFAVETATMARVAVSRVTLREDLAGEPGKMIPNMPKNQLCIGCGSGALQLDEVIPSGGKPMTGAAFRNGRRGEVSFSPGSELPGCE